MIQSVDYSPIVMPMHNVASVSSLRSATASHPTLHSSSLPQDLQGSASFSKDQSTTHYHTNTQPAFHATYHHESKHQNDHQHTASTPRSFFHTETKQEPKQQQNDQPVLQHLYQQHNQQSSAHHPHHSEIDATALESLLEISKPRPSSPRSPGSPNSRSALMSSSPSLSSSSSSECLHDVPPDSPPTEYSGEVSKDLSAGSKPNPSENDAAAALLFMKKSDSGLNLHMLVSGQKRGSDDDMKISSSSDSIATLGSGIGKAPVAKRVKRHCVKCGKTNEKTWRRGPTGEPNYCNACGVRWSRQQKKDEQLRNSSDRSSKLPRSFSAPSLDLSSGFSSDGGSSGNSINIPIATASPASIRASCDNIPRMIGEISVRDSDDMENCSE